MFGAPTSFSLHLSVSAAQGVRYVDHSQTMRYLSWVGLIASFFTEELDCVQEGPALSSSTACLLLTRAQPSHWLSLSAYLLFSEMGGFLPPSTFYQHWSLVGKGALDEPSDFLPRVPIVLERLIYNHRGNGPENNSSCMSCPCE